MATEVEIHLYGSLPKIVKEGPTRMIRIPLDGPIRLRQLLDRQGIPFDKIQLVMHNHKAAYLNITVRPGDRLALFPREYPFFADWHHYRNDAIQQK